MEDGIGIGTFIEQVRTELLEYQEAHEGKPGALELESVEMTITVGTTTAADGGVAIYVVEVGGSAQTEKTHELKLTLKPLDSDLSEEEREIGRGDPRYYRRRRRPPRRRHPRRERRCDGE